jgi:rod shape-determining protein MreC
VQRVSLPFRDLWGWGRGLANARDEAQRLQEINQRQAVVNARYQQELADRTDYRTLLNFTKNPRFADLLTGFTPRGADVIERPVEPDAVRVLIDSGSNDGVAKGDAVVVGVNRDQAALVGLIERTNANSSVVTLITSPDFAIGGKVPTAQANGLVRPGSDSGSLELDDVPKRYAVKINDVVTTSGWQDAKANFQSRLPKGIPIGVVTQVNDPGDALVKVIQVTPLVDLDAFSHVLVLTRRGAAP